MNKVKYISLFCAVIAMIVIYGLFDPAQSIFPKCIFKILTGLQCPGCGSQRAVHQMLNGNLFQAFDYNPLLMPALAYALGGLILPFILPSRWPDLRRKLFGVKASYAALSIIILFFIGRNLI